MALIRLEWVPIATFGLGLFGFDHLQLVYQPDEAASTRQEDWFVIEGTRDVTTQGILAGVQGNDGRTTLAKANAASGEDLVNKIGTPESRGSRPIPFAGNEFNVWQAMAAIGRDIEDQDFPYIAYGLPGSPLPTVNSASVVASLLYYAGVEISERLPFGMHLSPGLSTLLGTSGDDELQIEGNFTTILSGRGDDVLRGSSDAGRTDRLFGGGGDDTFFWSIGFNILHGGQPQLNYEQDGIDTVDYSGAGVVTLSAHPGSVPHTTPQFIATFAGGTDHLYSIERIKWGTDSDRVIVNPGVDVIEDDMSFDMGSDAGGRGDTVDFAAADEALAISASGFDELSVGLARDTEQRHGLRLVSVEWVVGSPMNDRIFVGPGQWGVEGGARDDLIDAHLAGVFVGRSPSGYDVELDGGAGDDMLVVGRGRTLLTGGDGADRFVLAAMATSARNTEMVIADAEPVDRLYLSPDLIADRRRVTVSSELQGDDLVIKLTQDASGRQAMVRIRNFSIGDLGIQVIASDEIENILMDHGVAVEHAADTALATAD